MTLRQITPPAELAVSLADAKLALKIDDNDQDELVEAWVAGIVTHAENLTGRSFVNQVWRVTLDAFPAAVELPRPPIATVTFVKFYDANGALQTLAPQDYTVDAVSEPGYVVPAPGKSWPATSGQINAVQVEYSAGYGADAAAIKLKAPDIRLYIIAKLREQYDPAVKSDNVTVQSCYLDRLLDGKMVYA